ncbi:MAG: helix-turn-helix domain-containing protein [Clostridia bacterium]|nr:helix-turn-helix domain-containing protein [Clostridia bacterium]
MLALSENIRRLRRAAGLSQEELAGRLGVSRQSVSLWEQGVTNPTVENIYAMAEVLGVSFNELMAAPADPAPTPEGETVTARSYDELMREAAAPPPATAPTDSFTNTPAPPPETDTPAPRADERRMKAEAQYARYRRLTVGAWICAGITVGALILFIFAVAGLGDYAIRYPESAVNRVIGPGLMLFSILLFVGGLIALIVTAIRAGNHRRRMGDLFDLATYEELKRSGEGYATKRK